MTPFVALEVVFLAALWGASFLFMRVGAPEFGPAPMMSVRVIVAAVLLLPILLVKQGAGGLRAHFPALCVVGVTNSAIPFTLLTFSTLHLSAGFTSILNATVPFWTALISYVWLGERLGATRASTVTFLIPAFGIIWGAMFLDEVITLNMLLGAGLILLGTSLTLGIIGARKPA